MSDEDDTLMQNLERQSREQQERTRQFLFEQGRPDLVFELDANLKDVRTGVSSARGTWHALSKAQRRVLRTLHGTGHKLRRTRGSNFEYEAAGGNADAISKAATLPTIRNLCRRELLVCEGDLRDPERVVVLTDHGRFVLAHGPLNVPSSQDDTQ